MESTFKKLVKEFKIENFINKEKSNFIFSKKIEDFDKLKSSILETIRNNISFYWKNDDIKNYKGISLTYDPENLSNIYSQTLGDDGNENYNDSMKFCYLNPIGKKIYNILIDCCPSLKNLQITKSRIAILEGHIKTSNTWHRDESPYECLRINIPIQTNSNYFFQLDNNKPVNMKEGYLYWFDTRLMHRFFNKDIENFERIHLILGFSPWFNFNYQTKKWNINKYFPKHPMNIIDHETIINNN